MKIRLGTMDLSPLWQLTFLLLGANCEVLLTIQKPPTERFTSIAVANDRVYVTKLDLSKESGRSGEVSTFKIGSTDRSTTPMPTLTVSPISVRVDQCNRLWILDSGVQNISGLQNKEWTPKLEILDLKSGMSVGSHTFSRSHLSESSFLANFIIAPGTSCKDVKAYVADLNRPAILIYDMKANTSSYVKHNFFNPDPTSDIPLDVIYNRRMRDASGLFGMAIMNNDLYFHALASTNEFRVPLESLTHTLKYTDVDLVDRRPVEAGTVLYDKTSSVFLYAGFKAIGCVGSSQESKIYTETDVTTRGFIADISAQGGHLYVLSNDKNVATVERFSIDDVISGTPCKVISNRLGPDDNYLNFNHTDSSAESISSQSFTICSVIFVATLHSLLFLL